MGLTDEDKKYVRGHWRDGARKIASYKEIKRTDVEEYLVQFKGERRRLIGILVAGGVVAVTGGSFLIKSLLETKEEPAKIVETIPSAVPESKPSPNIALIDELIDSFRLGRDIFHLSVHPDLGILREFQRETRDGKVKGSKAYELVTKALTNPLNKRGNINFLAAAEDWLRSGNEKSSYLYFNEDRGFYYIVDALMWRPLYLNDLNILINKGFSEDALNSIERLVVRKYSSDKDKTLSDFMMDSLKQFSRDHSSIPHARVSEIKLSIEETLRHDSSFIAPVPVLKTNEGNYRLVAVMHNHNGTGYESKADLETSKEFSSIVACYIPELNIYEMRYLENSRFVKSERIGLPNAFRGYFSSNPSNISSPAIFKESRGVHNKDSGTFTLHYTLQDMDGLSSLRLFREGFFAQEFYLDGVTGKELTLELGYNPSHAALTDRKGRVTWNIKGSTNQIFY